MALELAGRRISSGRKKRSEAKVFHGWALWGYLEEEPGYENSIRISGGFFRSFVYQGLWR